MFAQIADSGGGARSAALAIVAILTLNRPRRCQLSPEEGNQHRCLREEPRLFLRMNAIKSSTRELTSKPDAFYQARFDAEIPMVTKCVNPACTKPFLYLTEGKVLRVSLPNAAGSFRHPVEHFWLCGPCSGDYELIAGPQGSVSVVPKRGKLERSKSVSAFPSQVIQNSVVAQGRYVASASGSA